MKDASMKMERHSPVHLPGKHQKTEIRDHWPVILEYVDEGPGPWLVDLSHCRRWDIQGRDMGAVMPFGLSLPNSPEGLVLHEKGIAGRTGRGQAFLWIFDDDTAAPSGTACTEVTEGALCLALLGKNVFQVTERLTSLDLIPPKRKSPFLLIGPFAHVTSQVAVLSNDLLHAAILISCARGFAHDLVHTLFSAGEETGLRPAGESRFKEVYKPIQGGHR